MSEWFIIGSSQIYGPYSPAQMRELSASETIKPSTQVRLGRDGKVILASKVQGLFDPKPTPEPVADSSITEEEQYTDGVEDSPTESRVSWQYESAQPKPEKQAGPLDAFLSLVSLCVVIINVFGGIVSGIWLERIS